MVKVLYMNICPEILIQLNLMTVGDKLEKRQTKPWSRTALRTVAIYMYMYVYVRIRTVYDSAVRARTITCIVSRAKKSTQHNATTHEPRGLERESTRGKCFVVYSSRPCSLLSICSLAVGYSLVSPIL